MTQDQAEQIRRVLAERFEGQADFELVNNRGRYRFAVVAPQFSKLSPLERQDQIWAIVEETTTRETMLDISLILAYAPKEIEQAA